jgi:hypothetical protein
MPVEAVSSVDKDGNEDVKDATDEDRCASTSDSTDERGVVVTTQEKEVSDPKSWIWKTRESATLPIVVEHSQEKSLDMAEHSCSMDSVTDKNHEDDKLVPGMPKGRLWLYKVESKYIWPTTSRALTFISLVRISGTPRISRSTLWLRDISAVLMTALLH